MIPAVLYAVPAFLLLIISMFVPGSNGYNGAANGWTIYPPLSTTGTPGPAMDFVILALPAFALALAVWRLREPKRGGLGVLAHESRPPPPEALADEGRQETDAQRVAREQGLVRYAAFAWIAELKCGLLWTLPPITK